MARLDGKQAAQEHLVEVAKSMVQAVYKAPLTTGRLKIQTEIITGDDLIPIIEVMGQLAKVSQFIRWDYLTLKENYEAGNPPILVLIGADSTVSDMAWNCGACGFATCKEFNAYTKENRGQGLAGILLVQTFKKLGTDLPLLKGAMLGMFTWQTLNTVGQRVGIYTAKPHLTKTGDSALWNNFVYGTVTAYSVKWLAHPSVFLSPEHHIGPQEGMDPDNNKVYPEPKFENAEKPVQFH